MFMMRMHSWIHLKRAVELIRNIPMTIEDVLGDRILFSRHGVAAVHWVIQPGKLMAVVLYLNGPSKFDVFQWNEDGYRTCRISFYNFIRIFQLERRDDTEENFVVCGGNDNSQDKVSFVFVPPGLRPIRRAEIQTERRFDEPPRVDEYPGSTITTTSALFECILYYLQVPEEGSQLSLRIQMFPNSLKFSFGHRMMHLARQSGAYLSSPGTGQTIEINMSHAASFFKALDLSEEVSIIQSFGDYYTLLKFSTSSKGADLIFFIKGLPIDLVR